MTTITANGVTFDLDNLTGTDGRGYNVSTDDGSGTFFAFYIAVMSAIIQDASRNLITTSTSSVVVGTGTKTFVLAVDLPLFDGLRGQAVDRDNSANVLDFTVTTYVSGTKTATVSVFNAAGSGTLSNWDLMFGTGLQGATGAAGGVTDLQRVLQVQMFS